MKILILGAGVLGSVYSARLQESGQQVSILARGKRLDDIRKHGVVLEHALKGDRTTTVVNIVDCLTPQDAYDLIVVLVRKNQVSAVLPVLAANKRIPNILFMVNNPSGYAQWVRAVGRERLLLGFAGAGGAREGHVIRYVISPRLLQPTTFGELDGRKTLRLKEIVKAFKSAGFPVATSHNMDAWQKTHIALVLPLTSAIYMAGGDNYRLAHMPEVGRLMVRAIREGFRVLRALRVPVTPRKLRFWELAPEPLLIALLLRSAKTKLFETVVTRHANAAREEMKQLSDEFRALARSTAVATPASDRLYSYIEPPAA